MLSAAASQNPKINAASLIRRHPRDVDFYVLAKGGQRQDGSHRARILWEKHQTDDPQYGTSPISTVTSATDSFIKALKKARGEK
jgi:hypothetical protein